ncbi:MAG: HlyD family efflux transporter periplasmic adaptor subunit [Succinivibrio sp.]|nr:HlyD family efflux transporter periplasmic adaptor subunit [Succinivibrio sp.]MDY6260888.1 HlyD family efflux transporter periplasmic adaptor subunit [Succinivibrio sp.]
MKLNSNMSRGALRTLLTMFSLLIISSTLIYFGSRGDATTIAKSIKSGVLTADTVDVSFENVGGVLLKRDIEESQIVKKGDVLMVLDDTDTAISIERTKATIEAQKALILSKENEIEIRKANVDLEELTKWKEIEQLKQSLTVSESAKLLAQKQYKRANSLVNTRSISKSDYDSANSQNIQAGAAKTQALRKLQAAIYGATEEQIEKLKRTGSAKGMTLLSIKNERLEIDNMQNALDNLKSQLKQAEVQLKQEEVNYSRLTLIAPCDGKVLKILYQQGELVSPNSSGLTLETDRKYFDIYVSEDQVLKYKKGNKVKVHCVATNEDLTGTVRFATVAPTFADLRMTRERGLGDLTSFQVRIYVDSPEVLTGMTMEVRDE